MEKLVSADDLRVIGEGSLPVGLIKLGENLELDTQAYELRRDDRAVKLERIPMEILLFLLERRMELVTREQIAERVWGKGVFLDTDNSINAAIHKIRQALRDDPENPRFIRTITGKGYRFIATPLEGSPARAPASAALPAAVPVSEPGVSAESQSPAPSVSVVVAPAASVSPPRILRGGWWIALTAAVMVGVAGAVYVSRSSSSASPYEGRAMLAVLPFENLTGDPSQDYFSDGFTEEMITRLGTLAPRRLGVIARTSVMYYKQARAPLDRLARELGVQYVLEGSIRRDARHVRITAQLIQVKDQSHLWAQQYDREQTDVLQVEEEIARAIANEIDTALGPFTASRAEATAAPMTEKGYEAYEYYLRGRYFWNKRTKPDLERAIEAFQHAIDANPEDARGYAGLADAYVLMFTWSYLPAAEAVPKARAAALKALEINPNLAAALPSLATINQDFDLDWKTAEERFRRAIELDPNYATAHHWYAEMLAYEGRFDESLRESALAMKLDPRSLIIAVDHAYFLAFAGQYDRAIAQFRAVMAVDPRFPKTAGIIGAYVLSGQYDQAMAEVRRWKQFDEGPGPLACEADIYGRLGQMEKAGEALKQAEAACARLQQDPTPIRMLAYMGMGRKEEVMAILQEQCRKNPSSLVNVKVNPYFHPLRDDPRFDALIRCAHLEP